MQKPTLRRVEVRESGFSVIELMTVLLVFSIMSATALSVLIQAHKNLQSAMGSSILHDSGLRALGQMTREIRMAGFPSAQSFSANAVLNFPGIVANTVTAVSAYDVKFEADIDGDGMVEQVEYVLPSGSQTILRNVTKKNLLGTLALSSPVSQTLLDHVQNQILGQPLFTWQVDTSSSKPFPQNIRTVYINVVLTTNPGVSGVTATLPLAGAAQLMNP